MYGLDQLGSDFVRQRADPNHAVFSFLVARCSKKYVSDLNFAWIWSGSKSAILRVQQSFNTKVP